MQKSNNEVVVDKAYLVNEKKSPFALVESFRNLASSVSFSIPKKKDGRGKVVCVSSAQAGEGKSTISANLALTLAASGEKTILIDCDMRKPRLRKFFKVNKPGIVSYLSGEAEYKEVLIEQVVPNLDVIVGKKIAPNPAALLNSDLFDDLIKKLETEYDYVVIDTPPLTLVSDCVNIGAKTDGVILVARRMISTHKALQESIAKLNYAGCQILGFAFNDYEIKEGNYYNKKYKYGKYGYKYGYGYGHRSSSEESK